MKRLILAAIFCMFAATSFAQNNALGLRAGGGAELQYERFLNSGNVLKVNAGLFDFDGSFFGTVVHNWELGNWDNWTPKAGEWFTSVFCESTPITTVTKYGTHYRGRIGVLNGVPYKISVEYE